MVFDKPHINASGGEGAKKTRQRRVRFSPHAEVHRYELEEWEKRGTKHVPSATTPSKSAVSFYRRMEMNFYSVEDGDKSEGSRCRRRRGKTR